MGGGLILCMCKGSDLRLKSGSGVFRDWGSVLSKTKKIKNRIYLFGVSVTDQV